MINFTHTHHHHLGTWKTSLIILHTSSSSFGNMENRPLFKVFPPQQTPPTTHQSSSDKPPSSPLLASSLAFPKFKNKYLLRHMISPVFLKLTFGGDTNHMLFELETLPLPPMENNMNNRPFSKVRLTRMAHQFKSRVKIRAGANCVG